MSGLNTQALDAACAAFGTIAPGPEAIKRAIVAYLAIAHPEQKASPEESARFQFEGRQMVSVVVARSLPFAKALLHEWSLLDGRDRSHMLKWKSITIEAATYDAILDRVRLRLRPGGLDE